MQFQFLRDMFPTVSMQRIRDVYFEVFDVESAIEILLRPANSLFLLLKEQQNKLIDMNDSNEIEVARACIPNKAAAFYKASVHKPSLLRKNLLITFSGEEGIDAGALKIDFFLSYFKDIKNELFEGVSNRLVPKNYNESALEIAGAAVAHSILLGGPGFPTLHPAVYAHLARNTELYYSNAENVAIADFPCADDIPLNLSTIDMKDFINEVRSSYTTVSQ